MRKSDFHYDLPPELIAQSPIEPRSASRLLVLDRDTGARSDRRMVDLPSLLRPGDLLVFNDTRVIPARLFGHRRTGGKVEALVERVTGEARVLAQIRPAKSIRVGEVLAFGDAAARVVSRADFFELEFLASEPVGALLDRIGRLPLPPYIKRNPGAVDRERYQTVFARAPGAAAAPTAGLHFDAALLERLKTRGIETTFITLHVGAGTFQPVRVEEITRHRMHAETIHVDQDTCARINAAKRDGRRVIAVGTTVVRALETVAQHSRAGALAPFTGDTSIFIHPDYSFRVIDALITNFHLPESTLLMLVCAFAGTETILAAYAHAVRERYRFFSYGDAMYISSR